jgi:membrane protein required for beta-lactamase induction
VRRTRRRLQAAGRGLWHFVVGDSPEFLVVVLGLVGFALALRHVHPAVWVGLPTLVLGVLAGSLWRWRRRLPAGARADRAAAGHDHNLLD